MAAAGHSSRTQRARSCPNKCAGKPNTPVYLKAPRGEPSQVSSAATSKARTTTHTRTHISRQDPATVSQPDGLQLAKQRTPVRTRREGEPGPTQRPGATKGHIIGKHTPRLNERQHGPHMRMWYQKRVFVGIYRKLLLSCSLRLGSAVETYSPPNPKRQLKKTNFENEIIRL